MSTYHTPVLFDESLTGLITNTSGIYADATFGGGGHTAGILSRLDEDGRVIAFDRDGDALENKIDDPRLTLVRGDFRFILNYALEIAHSGSLKAAEAAGKKEGTTATTGKKEGTAGATKGKGTAAEAAWDGKFDGILADLGVSSHQFDTAERGFSFRYEAPLDMRMNRKGGKTAAEVVNEYSQEALEKALSAYGELTNARKLAQMIVAARNRERIETTEQLNRALRSALPKYAEYKFLAKVYQALRIEVNHEMRSLKKFLEGATESLKEGGRLVVITYHSLEDRMVKNFIKTGRADGREEKDLYGNTYAPLRPVNRKPILPAEEEIAANTRARSAKLRIAEKIGKE
jgi:16S rRNA (cytosine1402-N4)-methyltransferase